MTVVAWAITILVFSLVFQNSYLIEIVACMHSVVFESNIELIIIICQMFIIIKAIYVVNKSKLTFRFPQS